LRRPRRAIVVAAALGVLFIGGLMAGQAARTSRGQSMHPLPDVAITTTVSVNVPSLDPPAAAASLRPVTGTNTTEVATTSTSAASAGYVPSSIAGTGSVRPSNPSTGAGTTRKSGGGTGEIVSSGSGG
jgi:hypothetical protein